MEQTMVNVGEYNKHWKRWMLLWLVVVVIWLS
jgi:hypothetical protein